MDISKITLELLAKDALPIIIKKATNRNADYDLVIKWCADNPYLPLVKIFHYRVDAMKWIIDNFKIEAKIVHE